jgi:hypothetical protein
VRTKFRQRISLKRVKATQKSVRYNLYLLKEEEMVAKNYQSSLAQVLQKEYSTDINEEWTAIKEAIIHSVQKSTGVTQNQKCNSWFNIMCKQEAERRNTARMKKLARHSRANMAEYREARMTATNMQINKLIKERTLRR